MMDDTQVDRLFTLGEEIRDALRKLAEDPVVHFESGPPVCPHCERQNPVVAVQEREASGPLNEIVIQATCLACRAVFYAIPLMWANVRNVQEAEIVMEERAEIERGQSKQA
jgi:hypothetical protein